MFSMQHIWKRLIPSIVSTSESGDETPVQQYLLCTQLAVDKLRVSQALKNRRTGSMVLFERTSDDGHVSSA
jgi:hypothetical protein